MVGAVPDHPTEGMDPMDTKHVRIWMRGWAGDDPDAVATTIADMVLDISDTARVTLACDAVAERFTTGGIAYAVLGDYDRSALRHRLMYGMLEALGNYADGLDGDTWHYDAVDESAYTLSCTLSPTEATADDWPSDIDGRFMEHMLMLADYRGVIQ